MHDGGVEPEARPEAWKLLLGVHVPGATRAVGVCCRHEHKNGRPGCSRHGFLLLPI